MELITIILIGISLSMDTFSLSLCYGTLNFTTTKIFTLSSIVGMFHFVMPGLGMAFGHLMNYFFILNIKILIFVIFFLLGLEMINNAINRNKKIIFLNKIGMIIFGFTVSIDSFLAGIGLLSQGLSIKDNGPLICLILMVAFLMGLACSFLFNRSDSNISENSKNQILGQMTLIETKYISNENETLACGILSTVSHTHALSTSHGSQSYSVVSPSHVHTIQNDRRYR